MNPTPEMVQAACDEYDEWARENQGTRECIEAMLRRAALAAPAPQPIGKIEFAGGMVCIDLTEGVTVEEGAAVFVSHSVAAGPVPLTRAQISVVATYAPEGVEYDEVEEIARKVELLHGITAAPAPATDKHRHSGGAPAGDWTDAEKKRGWRMDGATKLYCCYGVYCGAGHSGGCQFATPEGKHP